VLYSIHDIKDNIKAMFVHFIVARKQFNFALRGCEHVILNEKVVVLAIEPLAGLSKAGRSFDIDNKSRELSTLVLSLYRILLILIVTPVVSLGTKKRMANNPTSTGKRIVFTGGSGIAGRHTISKLLDYGYEILNVDLTPLDNPAVHTIKADLTQSGQAFNCLSSHFKSTQPFLQPRRTPDVLIHFAACPRNLLVTDDELFRNNTLSSYNIIEAACKLGIKKIVIASSITVYGITFADGEIDYPSFPVDEQVDTNPMDTYAISKLCVEATARGFARRFGIDIYVLRLGAVITPDQHQEAFDGYSQNPSAWKGHGWSYTDVRDLGNICHLCIETDGLGFQIFNAVNDEITHDVNTEEFLKKNCPQTPFTRTMGEREAPISNTKLQKMLGFKEEYSWKKYYNRR